MIKLLHEEPNLFERKILEGIYINQNSNISLNNKDEVVILGVTFAVR